jgi:hypothetical protein
MPGAVDGGATRDTANTVYRVALQVCHNHGVFQPESH